MPGWFENMVIAGFALAAVFFLAKYREVAAALHESERMKKRLSNDLDRYRDIGALRTLRDALTGARQLPVDDEGREHALLRDAEQQLHHLVLQRESTPVAEGERVTITAGGKEITLEELKG